MRRMYSEEQLERVAQAQAKLVKKDIATLVDSQGRDRFIEDDITIEEITGVTKTYGKWSLSGTHLMIVLCLSLADTTAISNGQRIAKVKLPEWVVAKINPLFATNIIERKTFVAYDDNYTSQDIVTYLNLFSENSLTILKGGSITLTSDKNVRIEFDLLIDNE